MKLTEKITQVLVSFDGRKAGGLVDVGSDSLPVWAYRPDLEGEPTLTVSELEAILAELRRRNRRAPSEHSTTEIRFLHQLAFHVGSGTARQGVLEIIRNRLKELLPDIEETSFQTLRDIETPIFQYGEGEPRPPGDE